MTTGYDALLLASFGGPEGPDEVLPFLERVTAGRGIPPERLLEVGQHYVALGGVSPLNAQNRALAAALEAELAGRGPGLPVYLGNRNSAPFLADSLRAIHADGHRRVLALATSAYSSYSGCRQYREDLAGALAESCPDMSVQVVKLRPYADRPGFLGPMASGLRQALADLTSNGTPMDDVRILFTTHSLPESMAAASGPDRPSTPADGLYVRQHLQASRRVIAAVEAQAGTALAWSLAFQSRSGPPHVRWLEPDVNDAIRDAAAEGAAAIVLVPIGFISDHIEVIWDLDTQARQTAHDLGLGFARVATPSTTQAFVSALVDLIQEAQGAAPLSHDEPWSRMCGPTCCVNASNDRPTVPGC